MVDAYYIYTCIVLMTTIAAKAIVLIAIKVLYIMTPDMLRVNMYITITTILGNKWQLCI